MPAIAWLRRNPLEAAWAVFAAANYAAMIAWPSWETIPFHFVWISLTLLYGFRVWRAPATAVVLLCVVVTTGASITADAFQGLQLWGELFEVPLMSAMFLAMVWHAQRRQAALQHAGQLAEARASLLERQERFLHDASHELRTPVTIARGHLELLRRAQARSPELSIALDELARIERIIERLLLLAKADQPDFLIEADVELEPFLEDVFVRWSEVAPRSWRLGPLASEAVRADPEALRNALDALLENAVKYSRPGDQIELRSVAREDGVVIAVADGGCGVPVDAFDRIFERFARADAARTRTEGGVGLGLAIVDAIAKAHGGRCTVRSSKDGSTFSLLLPRFRTAPAQPLLAAPAVASGVLAAGD
jgi:signal transduction histidine kinase